MRSSYSEENLEEWLNDILNRKGGRKFGRYHKELTFATIEESEDAELPGIDMEIQDEEEFAEEL